MQFLLPRINYSCTPRLIAPCHVIRRYAEIQQQREAWLVKCAGGAVIIVFTPPVTGHQSHSVAIWLSSSKLLCQSVPQSPDFIIEML